MSTPSRRKPRPGAGGREAGGRERRPAAWSDGEPSRDELAVVAEPSRGERRNEEARAALTPLASGERPAGLLAAVAVAGLLGLGNLVAWAAGAKIGGKHPGVGVLAFTLLTGALAGGMWLRRYWAVLAFEALLALVILVFSLFLVEASNVEAVVLCVAVIGTSGWLFWKLVRVMGRLALPRSP